MKIDRPIFIVDDDQDDHEIIVGVCEKLKICDLLKFFHDGHTVISHLRDTDTDPFLILCDINMPMMTGFELRDTLNSDPHLKKKSIPFVFYSTASTEAQVTYAFEHLAVQGFFTKGQSIDEIESRLQVILNYWSESKHPHRPK